VPGFSINVTVTLTPFTVTSTGEGHRFVGFCVVRHAKSLAGKGTQNIQSHLIDQACAPLLDQPRSANGRSAARPEKAAPHADGTAAKLIKRRGQGASTLRLTSQMNLKSALEEGQGSEPRRSLRMGSHHLRIGRARRLRHIAAQGGAPAQHVASIVASNISGSVFARRCQARGRCSATLCSKVQWRSW
jgi:hypothetical protein